MDNDIICRYYLRGCCRFGSKCRYSHEDRRQSFNDRFHVDNRNKDAKTEIKELFQVISYDILEMEKGRMWPLTAYGLPYGIDNIEGFEDISPDEIHYQFHVASKSNTVDLFIRNYEGLLSIAQSNRDLFKTKSAKGYNIVENAVNKWKQGFKKSTLNRVRENNNGISSDQSFNSNRFNYSTSSGSDAFNKPLFNMHSSQQTMNIFNNNSNSSNFFTFKVQNNQQSLNSSAPNNANFFDRGQSIFSNNAVSSFEPGSCYSNATTEDMKNSMTTKTLVDDVDMQETNINNNSFSGSVNSTNLFTINLQPQSAGNRQQQMPRLYDETTSDLLCGKIQNTEAQKAFDAEKFTLGNIPVQTPF